MRRATLALILTAGLAACGSDDPSTVAADGDGDDSTTSLTVDESTTVPTTSSTSTTTSTTVDRDTPVSDDADEPPTPPPTSAPDTTTTTAATPPPQGGGTIDPRKHGWDRAEVLTDGQTVRITYYAGVCDQLDHVEVAKSPEAVTITLWVGRDPAAGEVCIEMAEERTVDVSVGEPVGGREIRDGADA